MKLRRQLLKLLLVLQIGLLTGCQAWRTSGRLSDNESSDIDSFMRESLLYASRHQEPSESSLAKRNLKLQPAKEIQPATPVTKMLSTNKPPNNGGDKVSDKRATRNSSPKSSDLNITQPLKPNFETPPHVPKIGDLAGNSTLSVTPAPPVTPAINDSTEWKSQDAGEFAQPDTELIDSKILGNVNTFIPVQPVKQLPDSISDFNPLPKDQATAASAKVDSDVHQAAYLENSPNNQEEQDQDINGEAAANSSSLAEYNPNTIENKNNSITTNTKTTKNTNDMERFRHILMLLEKQIAAKEFQQLPSDQQNRLKLNKRLLQLALRHKRSPETGLKAELDINTTDMIKEIIPLLDRSLQNISQTVARERSQESPIESQSSPKLKLLNPVFCSQIVGYGNVKTVPSTEFRPGQNLLVYCEVENFNSVLDGKTYKTSLQGSYKIVNSVGETVQTQSFPEFVDQSQSKRRDFFIYLPIQLNDLNTGKYQCQIQLLDKKSQQTATLVNGLDFTVNSKVKPADRVAKRK